MVKRDQLLSHERVEELVLWLKESTLEGYVECDSSLRLHRRQNYRQENLLGSSGKGGTEIYLPSAPKSRHVSGGPCVAQWPDRDRISPGQSGLIPGISVFTIQQKRPHKNQS